jgi:hypothetical protein
MKVYDLVFMPVSIYMEILQDFPYSMLTQDIDDEIGLKYYCTETDKFTKKQYVFEVIDPKKVILDKLKYSF